MASRPTSLRGALSGGDRWLRPPRRRRPTASAPGFVRQALRIAAKDLRIEWRSREVFATMTFLAVVMVLIFSFAFVVEGARAAGAGRGGHLVDRAGRVGHGGAVARVRSRARRRGDPVAAALARAPQRHLPRQAAGDRRLMLVTETVLTALCGVLFSARVGGMLARVVLLLALGTVGFAAAGCVFSAALLRARGRDALLATLLYPIIVPIVIAGARGHGAAHRPDHAGSGGRPVLDAVPVRAGRAVRDRRAVVVRARGRGRLTNGRAGSRGAPSAVSSVASDGPNEKRTWRRKREARWWRRLPGLTSKNSPGTTITFCSSAARKKPMPSLSGGGSAPTLPQT